VNKLKLLVFLLLFQQPLIAQQRSCQDVLAVAESFMIDGNMENVGKILQQTRGKCNDDVSWYYIQYGYQSGIGNIDSAGFYMKSAVKIFPKNDSVQFLLAQTYLLSYDSLQALEGLNVIEKAIKLKTRPSYQLCRIQLKHAAGKLAEALEEVEKFPGAEKNYEAMVECGSLLVDLGKEKEALKKFNQAIKLDKFSPGAYLQKAELLLTFFNRQDEAMAALDTVEMIDTALADPSLIRAAFFESRSDFDNAISEYDQAIQTDSSVHQVYIFRGNCLKEIKEYDLAEEDYKRYQKLHKNESEINYLLADLYIAKEDYVAAAMLMSQMETKGESAYRMYITRAIALNNNGQYDDALKDFNKAEKFPERNVDLYYNRGLCYFNKEDYRNAKYDFERAKNMNPQEMEFQYMHCRAAFHSESYDEACSSCKVAQFHGYKGIDKKYLKNCK
jgi:tetratricopeptide (TPR) repeat protein